jgi:hypothetical protein
LHLLYVTMVSGKKHYLLKSIEENKEWVRYMQLYIQTLGIQQII